MSRRLMPLVPDHLSVVDVQPAPDHLVICVTPRPGPIRCPACRTPSRHRHGHYERTLADLPWQGRLVCLRLRLRRLLCRNLACPRRTFSEGVADVVRSHARRSERLRDVQRHLGLALGGEPAPIWLGASPCRSAPTRSYASCALRPCHRAQSRRSSVWTSGFGGAAEATAP